MKYPQTLLVIGLATMALTSCGTSTSKMFKPSLVGNERSVRVGNLWKWVSYDEVLSLADKHCSKYGRIARKVDSSKGSVSFDCIK